MIIKEFFNQYRKPILYWLVFGAAILIAAGAIWWSWSENLKVNNIETIEIIKTNLCGPEPPAVCAAGMRLTCEDGKWECREEKENQDVSNWKIYRNEEYGFEVKYPEDWIPEEFSQDPYGKIVSLKSPETIRLLNEVGISYFSGNLIVSFWPNINNEYARGSSWIGQRNYTSLADFFTDKNSMKQKIGNITIVGQNAYEVIIGGEGSIYGVMIEHNGIYELSFGAAWDKSMLGSTENQILATFKFIK